MRAAIIFMAILAFVCAERQHYDGYKVYRVHLTKEKMHVIDTITRLPEIDVWKMDRMGSLADVMVPPGAIDAQFKTMMTNFHVSYEAIINDVERTIKRESAEQFDRSSKINWEPSSGRISFTAYNRHAEINAYLADLAAKYPSVASVTTIGKSFEGRNLNVLKISTGGNDKRPAILVDAGIHAREWIAPAMALYVIQQLVENKTNSDLINKLDWYILPVFNPDGYEYTFTNNRLWRKTRSKVSGEPCIGTDGNRNFDFHWREVGASSNPCSDTYAGPRAFSEPETIAMRDFGLKIKNQVKLYLTFHSYGNYLLYPWGYTSALPSDSAELHSLGLEVNKALGNKYTVGSSTNVLYAAAGGSDDWFKGVAGVQLAYTIELPGGGSAGFDLPPSKIQSTVTETWKGVEVYANYVIKKFA